MKIKLDLVVSISSIAVALMALYLTYNQIGQSERHAKLSIRPNVDINAYIGTHDICGKDAKIQIEVQSNGLGPAVIKRTEACIEKKCFDRVKDLVKELRVYSGFSFKDFEMKYFDKYK